MPGPIAGAGIILYVIFLFLCIILPISAYCAQKWAYKCYKELRKLNEAVKRLETMAGKGDGDCERTNVRL